MQRRSFLHSILIHLPLVGCSTPAPQPPPSPPPLGLHLDPLSDLLPAGGLDLLVLIRWGEVHRALGPQLQLLLPPDGLDALSQYLGFELRQAEEILVGSYGATTLYLLRVPYDPLRVERQFRERLTHDLQRSNDGPGVVRVTGRIGETPRGLATLLPDVLAFEVGPTGPLKAVVAFAQGKLKKAHPALAAEPLRTTAAHLEDGPLRLFFSSHEASWKGAHGLLERAVAAAFSLRPSQGNLVLQGVLLGAWDNPPKEALQRLALTVQDVQSSPLGRLTGLDKPPEPFRMEGDEEVLRLSGVISADKLARGLRDMTRASMDELFPRLRQ
ncbi:MAG: hypothetical protein RMJ98_10705 [Myxococcales bacterium]|nr:hypothetical protein [Polyangiaceae bacterium]MDW8249755.1 hypothetical protein [Myxococcales bacterium]